MTQPTTEHKTYKAPEAHECRSCLSLTDKGGPGCKQCPAYEGTHFFPVGSGPDICDLIILGDVPSPERVSKLVQGHGAVFYHAAFEDDGGRIIREAVTKTMQNPLYNQLFVKYLYAVKCATEKPNAKTVSVCNSLLYQEFSKIHQARTDLKSSTRLTVLVCGTTALRALGITAHSFEDVQGKKFDTRFGDIPVTVYVTMSLKAIAGSVGKFSSVMADVRRALDNVIDRTVPLVSREKLEKTYVYPKTNQEVKELVDHIIQFTGNPKVHPDKWAISIDTETNTLFPHRDTLRLIMLSVSWEKEKAAAIVLWHPLLHQPYEEIVEEKNEFGIPVKVKKLKVCPYDPNYDPDQAWEDVKRLLNCEKPKILHNANYDSKVVWKKGFDIKNIQWCDMLAEHALEEDKRGQYRLKFLVKQFLPRYYGYEDKLQDALEEEEGTGQTESIEAEQEEKKTEVAVPEIVQNALKLLKLSPKFQTAPLLKKIEKWKESPDKYTQEISAGELLIKAKLSGEFKTSQTEKKKNNRKLKDDGGFEKIPLHIITFYACVDADVTRQLALIQKDRMIEEQIRIEEKRNKVERQLQYQRFKNKTTQVNRLCRDSENQPVKQPIISLVKERYIPRMRELAKVEFNGVTVDRKYLEEADALLDKAIKQAEEAIYKMAGERFNINSGKQLARFINENGCGFTPPETFLQEDENTKETKTINGFENALEKCTKYPDKVFWDGQRLRYKAVALTKTGQVQLTDKILKTYKQLYDCPLSNLLLAYKKAHKAKNTFLGNADLLSILDGCLHTNYFLHGTGTGRLSSSDLNMQNIPKGKLGGVICKKLFIPRYLDYVFVNADAKGAEVGIFSGYSGDAKLTEALLGGLDAHCFFSATVLNPDKVAGGLTGEARKHALAKAGIDDDHAWSYEDFLLGKDDLHPDKVYGKRLKKLRDNIKRVVFGILYGAKSRKIAEIAGIDEAFAQTIIDLLFTMFPTIPDFVALTTWELHTFGFVETYHGRQRRFPLDNAPGRSISQAERRALNFKVQATNSDIVLDTLVEIAPIIENDLKGKILLTVHDSIGFEVPKKYVPDLVTLFKVHGTEMTRKRNPWLPVPYKWDIECGPSYGETIPIKKYLELHKDEIDKLLTPSKELYEGFTIEEMYTELREAVLEPGS